MACNWNSSCLRSARIRHTNESIRKRGAPATRTAAGVEPPEGVLTSPVNRPHKTKNKSKRNQSTGTDTSKLPYPDNTHRSEAVRIFTAHVYPACCRVQCRTLFGQNRIHTCRIVFALANGQRCCEFVMTAGWSISKGMGVHREM